MSTTKLKPGQFWDIVTDPIMLYVQRVRIHSAPQNGWVEVQTERASGKLGKIRRVRASKFGAPGGFTLSKDVP